jgi:anti-sigma factor RsiW
VSTKRIMRKLRALMMRTLPMMLTCRELEDFVADYIDGVLPKQQRRTFELHIRLCPDCRRYLDAYKRTIALVGQTAFHELAEPVPEPVPEELVKAILAARREDS